MIVSAFTCCVFAGTIVLTPQEQHKITEEAEDWIDNMPEGMQDRLADAVLHSLRGFYNEIDLFRNYCDTSEINKYDVKVTDITSNNISVAGMRLYQPKTDIKTPMPLLIYFHGGGWSMGSLNSVEKFCRALVSEGNVIVVSVDYPLAPQHPYPAAINTINSTLPYIFSQAKTWGSSETKISLGGDGAGGRLAMDAYAALSEKLQIQSLVLYYPLVNTTGNLSTDKKREFGRGYGFDSRLWESYVLAYAAKEVTPSITLPPTLLISAGRDIIIDQEENLVKENKKVFYVEFEGAIHGFITDGQQKTAFNKAVKLTDAFLNGNL